ncbi:multi-copy leucine-rich repeat protein, putative, partial [Bodo saltans]
MGVRVLFGRGAAVVPQRMSYGIVASTPVMRNSGRHIPSLYDDPSTWPKQFDETQIKRLLKGKLKPGAKPPDYKALAFLHAIDSKDTLLSVLHTYIVPSATKVTLNEAANDARLSVVDDIARCIAEAFGGRQKNGNVFAALSSDQAQLDAMQLRVGRLSQSTKQKDTMLLGALPFKISPSVRRGIRRHVWDRENEGNAFEPSKLERTGLLCNSGTKGSGKTTLLLQTTVEAVAMLAQMVADHKRVGHEDRPLGFYVTFDTEVTNASVDNSILDARQHPILTAIALRMVYSVFDPSDDDTDSPARYLAFAQSIVKYCGVYDYVNFQNIVNALRMHLDWTGPMFI